MSFSRCAVYFRFRSFFKASLHHVLSSSEERIGMAICRPMGRWGRMGASRFSLLERLERGI